MKKALSILLSGILLMAVITAIPFTASAATDRVIDLSKSVLVTKTDTTMNYDEVDGILTITAKQYSGTNKPIRAVGNESTWCKEVALKYADGTLVKLEKSKRYAVTLNYTFVDNNGNPSPTNNHLPQIAVGRTAYTETYKAGSFYAAAVKNHAKADAGSSYYLSAEIVGDGNLLRIGFSGFVKFEINSVFLQEIDANAEDQVSVVYCDGGEYKAEFATEGGTLKVPAKENMVFGGWYSAPDFSGEKVTAATAGAVLYAKWIDPTKTDITVDLSNLYLVTKEKASLICDDGICEVTASDWYWEFIPIGKVKSISTGCREMGLKYADNTLLKLESGKRYAITLNYKFVNNNGNTQEARNLPQIAIGYDSTEGASSTSAGNFYVAAVKNHKLTDLGNNYYLNAEIVGNGKPFRIGFSGVWKFQINSISLQEIDANAEDQVSVVYCDGGEYKAEFETADGALKTPVKDGKKFVGWYSASDYSGEKVTLATAGAVLYAKWIDLIKGDLNEDGAVDIIDLVILKKASVNLNTDLKYDLDGDSQPANAGDLSFLRRLLLGIIG